MYQLLMYGLACDLWGHKCPYLLLTWKGEGHAVMGRKHHPWCQGLSSPSLLTKLKQQQKWAKKSPLLHSNGRRPFVPMSALTAAETCLLNVPKAFEVWIAANKG